MRTLYTAQLNELKRNLTIIGTLCEKAITMAMEAFFNGDAIYFEKASALEQEINSKEKEIEQACFGMLLHQQPVASDFRVVSSALKMITDIERIGDQAYDIANLISYTSGEDIKFSENLSRMASESCYMVRKSIDSFVTTDLKLAEDIIKYDDKVDDLFIQVRNEIIAEIKNTECDSEAMIDILMIAKYLERIADHATNIAEWVIFSINGIHESGN